MDTSVGDASVVGAQGRKARRLPRGLWSPRSLLSQHWSSLRTPSTALAADRDSLSLHLAALRGLSRALSSISRQTMKTRREKRACDVWAFLLARLSSAKLTLVVVRFALREPSALAQGPTCFRRECSRRDDSEREKLLDSSSPKI